MQKECLYDVHSLNSICSNSDLPCISGKFDTLSEICEDIPCYVLASRCKSGVVSSFQPYEKDFVFLKYNRYKCEGL